MTNLKNKLKTAVLLTAKELMEGRQTTPNLKAPGRYLIEDVISNSYEMKVLKEELRQLKSQIEDLENFEMTVRPIQYVKVEIMEARIETLKGYINRTNKVNRMVKKAVEENFEASKAKFEAEYNEEKEFAESKLVEVEAEVELSEKSKIEVYVNFSKLTTGEKYSKEIKVLEYGIFLISRLRCEITKNKLLVSTNAFKNKNEFREYLNNLYDCTIQIISDNRDLEAMKLKYTNFRELEKKVERYGIEHKHEKEYNRILNEVQL